MSIAFNQIPIDIRTVGSHIEFDSSKAVSGLPAAANKILVLGQRLAAGTVAQLVPTRIMDADQATQAFGRGSMLDRMVRAAKANDPDTEMWAVGLDDLAGGTAAQGSITITSAATGSGLLFLRIAGQSMAVPVTAGETVTTIAARISQTINGSPDLPVTASSALSAVTLTAKHKGTAGNDIDLAINYYQGEVLPAGVAVAFAAMTGGIGNPDLASVWAAIGDATHYRTILIGVVDTATLTALEAELTLRWGAMRQVEALAYAGARGTQGTLAALGAARNSPFVSIIGAKASPTPPWEWAAAYGAKASQSLSNDPARPLQTLQLAGVLAPSAGNRFTRGERELLLRDGISTFVVDDGGTVCIERAITTYQTNGFGIEDVAWLDINTPATLAYIRLAVRTRIALKFPRHKLADDGTAFGIGQFVATPNIIKAELVVLFREMEEAGLVEDFDQFKADLVVERDSADRNRVNALIPPNLINQLRVFAGRVEYRL